MAIPIGNTRTLRLAAWIAPVGPLIGIPLAWYLDAMPVATSIIGGATLLVGLAAAILAHQVGRQQSIGPG